MSNTLIQKVLTLVPLTATGHEVFVATMNIFLSDYYDALEEWLSPKWSQSVHGFFSEEEKQESTRMEDLAPEGSIISNIDPEGENLPW